MLGTVVDFLLEMASPASHKSLQKAIDLYFVNKTRCVGVRVR